jgi:hypothetical protein
MNLKEVYGGHKIEIESLWEVYGSGKKVIIKSLTCSPILTI